MKRLEAGLPMIGVVGLVILWYLAVWARVVDPVLLPPPTAAFRALWNGMIGGKLGADFLKTVERTTLATVIAAAVASIRRSGFRLARTARTDHADTVTQVL